MSSWWTDNFIIKNYPSLSIVILGALKSTLSEIYIDTFYSLMLV